MAHRSGSTCQPLVTVSKDGGNAPQSSVKHHYDNHTTETITAAVTAAGSTGSAALGFRQHGHSQGLWRNYATQSRKRVMQWVCVTTRHTPARLTARVEKGVRHHANQVLHEVEEVPGRSRPGGDHDLGRLRKEPGRETRQRLSTVENQSCVDITCAFVLESITPLRV